MAAHRLQAAPVANVHAPIGTVHPIGRAAVNGTVTTVGPPAPPTPAELAIAAAEAGNYSLKDISREAARQAERELILKMLQQTRWNRKETAEILGISYKALLYKIKENGLDKAS
jgi:DNA-binding NtrC family response regulator